MTLTTTDSRSFRGYKLGGTPPRCHRDGSVTYWSVYAQQWCRRVRGVSDAELAAMPTRGRARVIRHLDRYADE